MKYALSVPNVLTSINGELKYALMSFLLRQRELSELLHSNKAQFLKMYLSVLKKKKHGHESTLFLSTLKWPLIYCLQMGQ